MNIARYLKKNNLSQAAFARMLDVSPGLVWQWLNDETTITAEQAKKIETVTQKEVRRHDLRPDLYERST
jgi:DNA-binding transcriptional regulator YdaS (Cro superfamily)